MMEAMSLLGLDIGTSATKGVLLDDSGRVIAAARRGYRVRIPEPGRAELSAGRVWAAARAVIASLAGAGSAARSPVRAVCVGGSGDEVVALDARGRPVGPVIMAIDRRSDAEGRALAETYPVDALYRSTGLWDLAITPVARLRWLEHHEARTAARVRRLLSWPEWIAVCLGLPPAVDPTLAARTLAYDLTRGAYAGQGASMPRLAEGLLSPVVPTGTILGAIPRRVASTLGLPDGTRYVVGGFDQAMARVGAGALDPSVAHDGNGSWEALSVGYGRAVVDPRLRDEGWSLGPSVVGDQGREVMGSWAAGVVLRWAAALGSRGSPETALERALGRLPSRHARVVAHVDLTAPPSSRSRGSGAFVGLDLSTGHDDLMLAVLDGLAHRLRRAIAGLRDRGVPVAVLRVTGGGAASDRWLRLKADATTLPVERPAVHEAGAFAAAVLAGSAVGSLPAVDTAIRQLVRVAARFEPDAGMAAWHEERAGRHVALATALETLGRGGPPTGAELAGQ